MTSKFAQSVYIPKNPQKYIGAGQIFARSSWETSFCKFCDNNPSIIKWSSESLRIPYRNPLTNQVTTYVPDFFIQYTDKLGRINSEVIEIKPANQTLLEKVGRSKYNQAQFIKNQAKWAAAELFCKQNGLKFRVINENQMFHNGQT